MKIKRLVSLGSATLLSLSSLLTLAMPMAHAAAQTCEWVGGTDLKFSTAANWASCGGGAPGAGDILLFDKATTNGDEVDLTNDLGVALGGVQSAVPTSGSGSYKINTISLAAGAALSVVSSASCNGYPVNVQYGTVNAAGDLTVDNDGHTLDSTNLSVGGNLTIKNSIGYGALMPASGSAVTGNVTVASPSDYHTTTCAGGLGGGIMPSGSSLSGFTVHGLTVEKDASVDLANGSFPLTLGGGSGSGSPVINFWPAVDNDSNPTATTYNYTGSVTLLANAQVYAADMATANLTGSISGTNFALTMEPTSEGTININSSSNDSKTTTGTQTNPVKTTTISDNQAGDIGVVSNETTVLDGTRDYVTVYKGGVLKGSGTADQGINVHSGATVAPGHSPGCLTTSSLTLSGTYQAEIGGTTACSGYDQIKVTSSGVINLTGGTLVATLYNGFVPKVGQSYTIIDNQSTNAVAGTFTGIAEGGTYTNDGVTYTVTYKGGDGNDVVLTVKAVDASKLPKTPNTGMKLVAAHPMAALATTSFAALGLVLLSRRMKPAAKRR